MNLINDRLVAGLWLGWMGGHHLMVCGWRSVEPVAFNGTMKSGGGALSSASEVTVKQLIIYLLYFLGISFGGHSVPVLAEKEAWVTLEEMWQKLMWSREAAGKCEKGKKWR